MINGVKVRGWGLLLISAAVAVENAKCEMMMNKRSINAFAFKLSDYRLG
jgi:hypothetical protein